MKPNLFIPYDSFKFVSIIRESYVPDQHPVTGFRFVILIEEQDEVLAVYIELVVRQRLPAGAVPECLQCDFPFRLLLPAEREEGYHEIPSHPANTFCHRNGIYTSDRVHFFFPKVLRRKPGGKDRRVIFPDGSMLHYNPKYQRRRVRLPHFACFSL